MADLLDDDGAFDDIFGDSIEITAGKDGALTDSAKKQEIDNLLDANFDDIFGSLESPPVSPTNGHKTMSFESDLLEVEKAKVETKSSVMDEIAAALRDADSVVEAVNLSSSGNPATSPSSPKPALRVDTSPPPSSAAPSSLASPGGKGSPVNWETMKMEDKDDFLSWLGEGDDGGGHAASVNNNAVPSSVVAFSGDDDAAPHGNSTKADDGTGNAVSKAMLAVETAAAAAEREPYDVTMRRSASPRKSLTADEEVHLAEKIKEQLQSPHPGAQTVRDICRDYGGVPAAYRSRLWALFLGVSPSSSADRELEQAMTSPGPEDFLNQDVLRDDVLKAGTWAAIALSGGGGELGSRADNIAADMETLLSFYVRRRGIRRTFDGPVGYVAGLADMVAPFYAAGAGSPEAETPDTIVIFKCLYALCSAFMPTAHALSSPRNPWPQLVYHEFRRLLKYHDPALEAHMTAVDPKWSAPQLGKAGGASGVVPSACFFRGFAGVLSHVGLLRLWDYLLVEADPYIPWFVLAAALNKHRGIIFESSSPAILRDAVEQIIKSLNSTSNLEAAIAEAVQLDAATPKAFRKRMRWISSELLTAKHKRGDQIDWRHRFWDFYMVYNQEKIEDAISLIPQFPGKESELARRCEEKYNAPMTGYHLVLRNSFVSVSANEIVPQIIERSERYLRYFLIDCRPTNEVDGGRFGQAFSLNPQILKDKAACGEMIASLSAIKGQAHIAIMGSGKDLLLESFSLIEAAKYAAHDIETVGLCAEAFVSAGFPYVSVVEGGFFSCYRTMEQKYNVNGLVDVSPRKCRPLRFDNYAKLEREKPDAAKLLRAHALHALEEKIKKEKSLMKLNGDPEVEAALAMAMEAAKTGQSLKDKKQRESIEKTISTFKVGFNKFNRSFSDTMKKGVSAINKVVESATVTVDDMEERGEEEGGDVVDVPAFIAFSIDDFEDDEDTDDAGASLSESTDGASVPPPPVADSAEAPPKKESEQRKPVQLSYEECAGKVALERIDEGAILVSSMLQTSLNHHGDGSGGIAFACDDLKKGGFARTRVETFLFNDRLVSVKVFYTDGEGFPVLSRRNSFGKLFTQTQARIAAERAKAARKEISRRFSRMFSKEETSSKGNTGTESPAVDAQDDAPAINGEAPVPSESTVPETKAFERECVEMLCNQSLGSLKKMTVKKNDVSVVSLYFGGAEPVVIKFKDREGFQAALKNTLKIIKLKKKQMMAMQQSKAKKNSDGVDNLLK
jgi:hypothetical protein